MQLETAVREALDKEYLPWRKLTKLYGFFSIEQEKIRNVSLGKFEHITNRIRNEIQDEWKPFFNSDLDNVGIQIRMIWTHGELWPALD
ncbi:45258_t:CDS:2 [Gigaspora margarita]|uniref:45258_t:CDS:1 n=1 Tax=Gigaspora margarita TaxID=4874 RepID=A0ABN7VG03_GIGMA|nr:45258_t:CDS:2 [Gigaspora margarita]